MRREDIAFRCENVPTVARGCSNGVRGARMDSKTSVIRGPRAAAVRAITSALASVCESAGGVVCRADYRARILHVLAQPDKDGERDSSIRAVLLYGTRRPRRLGGLVRACHDLLLDTELPGQAHPDSRENR